MYSTSDSLINEIILRYNAGEFSEAERICDNRSLEENNDQFSFYIGLVKYQLGKMQEAEAAFNDAKEIKDISVWYLALIKLNQEKPDEAKELLQEIAGKFHPRAEQATRLLEEME
jgi:tetratricopeptide (TPR) repeat protein